MTGDPSPADLADVFRRLAKRIRRRTLREFAPLALSPSTARALRVLVAAEQPPRVRDLATSLDILPRSATSIVEQLEQQSLVAREPDPSDRRSVRVVPTAAGRDLAAQMLAAINRASAAVFAELDGQSRRQLWEIMSRLDAVDAAKGSYLAGQR